MTQIIVNIPIFLAQEGNRKGEHWGRAYKRHRTIKTAVSRVISPLAISTPCHINLTRYAPHMMDSHDNLPYSFKPVVDTIAAKLIPGLAPGHADSHSDLSWSYNQVKSNEKRIEILFEF